MTNRRFFFCTLVFSFVAGIFASPLHAAYIYPLEVFTYNGGYYNSPNVNLYVEVSDIGAGRVDFTFYNESLIESSIARIYFDDDLLLDIADISEGDGTSFSQPATPGNLPGGNMLEPAFVTTNEFRIGAGPPPPKNGVNPDEWLRITFDYDGIFEDVIDGLDAGTIRIGAHVIALPDGSSESVIAVPEPATVCLLGLGTLVLLRKRRP